jgi:hypothetical protein
LKASQYFAHGIGTGTCSEKCPFKPTKNFTKITQFNLKYHKIREIAFFDAMPIS